MLRDSTQRGLFDVLELEKIPFRFNRSENRLTFAESGSEILFRSLDHFERLRGTNLAWFGIDELTFCSEEAWLRLEARLRHADARRLEGFAAWTPNGFDWVYRRFIREPKEGYAAWLATPRENIHVGDMYDRLETSYDERFYRQEVLGEYLSIFAGAAYYCFDRTVHVAKLEYDPRFPLCWALDFNIDPMCSLIAQVIDTTTREEALVGRRSSIVNVLDEIVLPDTRTVQACEAFLKRLADRGWLKEDRILGVEVYGDASGDQRRTSSLKTDWQVVRDCLRHAPGLQPTFKVPPSNPPVRDRVISVNSMLRSRTGDVRLRIDGRCKELAADFEQVSWLRDNAGMPLNEKAKNDPKRTHLSDALDYLIWPYRPLRDVGGPRSQIIV